jgi:DNA polymerase III subunit gamma/tau
MLAQTYRPIRFKDIVGQREAVTVLQAVAKSPSVTPRVYILYGERGLGKTSLARIFARSLGCEQFYGEPCLSCESCISFSELGANYTEIDATLVGNADYMRQFRESLMYMVQDEYRVVTLDECHAASKESQGVLLSLFEEGPKNCFFLLCTTNLDKIKPEIRSRAVELSFLPVMEDDMRKFLERVCEREALVCDSKILDRIISVSSGHVRDAIMKLDLYQIIKDDEKFFALVKLPEEEIIDFFISIKERNREKAEGCIRALLSYPLAYVRRGFELFMFGVLRRCAEFPTQSFAEGYDRIVSLYGGVTLLDFLPVFSSDWFYSCFKNDLSFQGLSWYLYSTLSKQTESARSGYGDSDPGSRLRKKA